MKLRLSLLAGIVFFGTTLQAQQNASLENIVNEEFGTLLESLLIDGKIEEGNAKTYLETVFGNDETVNNYIQALNLSKEIQNIGKANLSIDHYVEQLGANLFNVIPENYRQQLLKNPNYIGWKLGQEMNDGKISNETLGNAIALIADSYKQNQKNKLVIEKLKKITPVVSSLKSSAAEKKVIMNDNNNVGNWKLNPTKIEKGFFSDASTYNKVTIESGNVVLDPTDGYADKFLNIYRNRERFDFSKNFKITIRGRLDPYEYGKVEYQASNFSILIGKYYLFDAYLMYAKKFEVYDDWSVFSVKTPTPEFTSNYGVYNYETLLFFTKEEKVKTVTTLLNKGYKKAGATENKNLNFNNGFELIVQNENGYLTYTINGVDTGIKQQVTYLPNKFSFDIKANIDRKTTIESVKLEYL